MQNWSHTSYECVYHVVFVPKYRKSYLYQQNIRTVWKILRMLAERLWCKILEWNLQKDHIHMVIEIAPKYSVSWVIWKLKWKSAILLFNEFGNKKNTLAQKSFWSRWYFVRTTWVDKRIVIDYVRNQSKKDKNIDWNQLDMKW